METKTDGAGKPAEETQQAQTDSYKGSLDQGSFDKVWSANRANETRAKELELRLKKIEDEKVQADKTREEALLKSRNDYEGLIKLKQAEYEDKLNEVKAEKLSVSLERLATKYGMNDPADAAKFIEEPELDDNGNLKDAEKAFESLKKSRPYLFKVEDKKPVPKTDNGPVRKPSTTSIPGQLLKGSDILFNQT